MRIEREARSSPDPEGRAPSEADVGGDLLDPVASFKKRTGLGNAAGFKVIGVILSCFLFEQLREVLGTDADMLCDALNIKLMAGDCVLTPQLANRADIPDTPAYLHKEAPWLYGLMRETTDRLADAGILLCIENEPEGSVFSRPDEIVNCFAQLARPGRASFTYDVQNLWQMGTFPSLDVYREIKPVVGYLHVKGGIADPADGRLKWRSMLERASWPVAEIVREALRGNTVPVICLNPSHGIANAKDGDPVRADLAFVRRLIAEYRR